MTLTFRPLHPHFVAEASPLDLRQATAPETLLQIRAGMDAHAILVFRDQAFSDDEQLAFCPALGRPIAHQDRHQRPPEEPAGQRGTGRCL